MSISITKKTSTVNTTASSGRSIKYIVIHYTAGTKSTAGQAANTAAYFAKTSTKASADFIVDDSTIVQYNPDIKNRYTWHCGGSKYSGTGGSLYGIGKNSNSIGVEICSTNSTGTVKNANDSTWSFTTAALKKATELVQYLMETYDIDVDHVVRHWDINSKPCPGIVGWNADSGSEAKWKSWKSGLTESSTSSTSTTTTTTTSTSSSSTTYTIKTGVSGTAYTLSTIQSGSTGEMVKFAQQLLNAYGSYGLSEDGIFGTKTTAAVKKYQKAQSLTQDGIIGKNTWTKLLAPY